MNIKYFVRTIPERTFNYQGIEYTKLVDYAHQPLQSFIAQLDLIGDYDAVLLEDDVILCNNFKDEIEKVIAKYPDKIINFYTKPKFYIQTEETFDFRYNQCTYYPKGVGKIVAAKMREILPRFGKQQRLWCVVERMALRELQITHIAYRPCLVQHPDDESILNSHDPKKCDYSTIYFKDYLDELNVDYADANTLHIRNKLEKIKFKHLGKK